MQRIEKKFDDELGDDFNIRNTVRNEFDKEKGSKIPTRIACVRTLNEIPLVMEKKLGIYYLTK